MMTLAGLSLFIFRWKRPEVERPYYVLWYPVIPGIFFLISSSFVISTLIERPVQAWFGIGILLIGILAYYLFKKLKSPHHARTNP